MRRYSARFIGIVELTDERWSHILAYHPDVRKFQKQIGPTLVAPETVRHSKYDPKTFIFYRRVLSSKYLAIVVKTNRRNFILTAYLTDRIQHQLL